MTATGRDRTKGVLTWLVTVTSAVVLPLVAGFGFAKLVAPTVHSRYFPWLTGRALGIAAYLSLTALVLLGIWLRHPWRQRMGLMHPESRLRLHASLGTATLALVAGHVAFLASDKYAGVGWLGAVVPFEATYRPVAIALGVVAMFYMVVLSGTARLAGRWGSRHWYLFHHVAVVTFALVWAHGVLAGTDTAALRSLYVVSGGLVLVAASSRYAVAPLRRRVDDPMTATGTVEGAERSTGALR